MTETTYTPESVHQRLLDSAIPSAAFDPDRDLASWRQELSERLQQVIGVMPPVVPLDVRVEWQRERDGYAETRFCFTAEPGADVPCHLLVPTNVSAPPPIMVCLQGHTTGMHVSLARTQDGEPMPVKGDRDFAMQAIRRGYAALVIEQRCFGERVDRRPESVRTFQHTCQHASHVATLLGRTMIGERVWDVRRALDALDEFDGLDTTRIGCMGNSGGGTITWYAACLEPRITAVMPSCSVCTYADSIAGIDHCCDNYLPGALRFFDMPDLAGLIAPRPLVVVAGKDDPIFPLDGVRRAFATIQAVYDAYGAADRCELVIGDGAHRFYAADAWPVFARLTGSEGPNGS